MIRIKNLRFPVESACLKNKYLEINFSNTIDDPKFENDLSIARPSIYGDEVTIVKDQKVTGELCLYVFEHEDFVDTNFFIKDGMLYGSGKATIMGEPCTVEVTDPIRLLPIETQKEG